jgi:protein ImuB
MSVWFNRWAIDCWRRRARRSGAAASSAGVAVLLAEQVGSRRLVAACCDQAARAGVRVGMPVGQARAAFCAGEVAVYPRAVEGESAVRRGLVIWAQRFSPIVAPDGADGLILDVTGCGPVFGGEAALVERASREFGGLGLRARVAIGPSVGAAWALARFGPDRAMVHEGGVGEAIAGMPLAALRVSAAVVEGLAEVGVERVGQAMGLPRAALPARFGGELLLRIDQALGRAMEPIEGVRAEAVARAVRDFEGPTTHWEAIHLCVRELMVELAAELRSRARGARLLRLTLSRSDLGPVGLDLALSVPTREVGHWWALVRPRLERLNLGYGVERVELASPWTGRVPVEQARAWEEGCGGGPGDARALGELIDTLANRLGAGRVCGLRGVDSHVPERQWAAQAWGSVPGHGGAGGAGGRAGLGGEGARGEAGWRPTRLPEEPEAARVVCLTPDGPVLAVHWRGEDLVPTACIGPERIEPEWWRSTGGSRDYFRVCDQRGRWLWLVRENALGRWAVQGWWA